MGITVKDLPSKCLSKPFTADKYHDPWNSGDAGGSEDGLQYHVADPGGCGDVLMRQPPTAKTGTEGRRSEGAAFYGTARLEKLPSNAAREESNLRTD